MNRCIETKEFEKTVHRKRNLGGRKAGAKYVHLFLSLLAVRHHRLTDACLLPPRRVEFTERDDQDLVAYIAEKIPYAEAGGRLGNNLYMELEANVSFHALVARKELD